VSTDQAVDKVACSENHGAAVLGAAVVAQEVSVRLPPQSSSRAASAEVMSVSRKLGVMKVEPVRQERSLP